MKYVTLLQLFYRDKGAYSEDYLARFHSPNAVRLDFQIHGNQAFYLLTPEVLKLTSEILQADKKISLLKQMLPGAAIHQFTRRCLIDEIVVTNRIEGVHSTRRELYEVLGELESQAERKHKPKRFSGLVNKYMKLQSGEEVPLRTITDIRRLYDELVLQEVLEENPDNAPDGSVFRRGAASIEGPTGKELHRGVYPESSIIDSMEKALQFLWDEDVLLLQRVSIFHYLMEYIHPFYDGNGRTGRFIVSYLLTQELDPLLAYRLSVTIAENINDYYEAFSDCDDPRSKGDLTPFLLMMLEMIRTSTKKLEQALLERRIRLDRYVKLIPGFPGADSSRTVRLYDMLIQAGLFSEHGVTIREISSFLECSDSTARKELSKIRDAKLLCENRDGGRELYYELDIRRLDTVFDH